MHISNNDTYLVDCFWIFTHHQESFNSHTTNQSVSGFFFFFFLWNFVDKIFFISFTFVTFSLNQPDNKPSSTMLSVFDSLMTLIIIVWFLCGNYWVYHDRHLVQYTDPAMEATYCNKTTYLFTFWFLNSVYILLGASVILFCCTIFFTIFIPSKK